MKQRTLLIVVISLSFALGCKEQGQKSVFFSQDVPRFSSVSQQSARKEKNCNDTYLQLASHIFKFDNQTLFGVSYKGRQINYGCNTSIFSPAIADSISFIMPINWPDSSKIHRVWIHIKNKENSLYFDEIEGSLIKEGKTIKNLPKVDSFYKYLRPGKWSSADYISSTPDLSGYSHMPLILHGCVNHQGPLSCEAVYSWKSDIFITAEIQKSREPEERVQMHENDSPDIWRNLFPVYLKTVESKIVK